MCGFFWAAVFFKLINSILIIFLRIKSYFLPFSDGLNDLFESYHGSEYTGWDWGVVKKWKIRSNAIYRKNFRMKYGIG